MALFSWQKKVKEDGAEEFTLPDELTTKIEAGKANREGNSGYSCSSGEDFY